MRPDDDDVLQTLFDYAAADENIRAALLEGSRAFGKVDQYSDYDITYVTRSNEPYFGGTVLPFLKKSFGEIAVMQTPDNGDPCDVYTHLIQFSSGIRIDLTFNSAKFLNRVPLESATAVLLDKDGRFANIMPPSDADFWMKQPSAIEFLHHCNEFWWCSPYVAKAAARGQTIHALEIFSERLRNEYRIMLSYLAGARNDWACVNLGKHCTDLKRFLPLHETYYYEVLINSYTRANGIVAALDTLMTKYNALAAAVADALGYVYDFLEAAKTIKFIQERFYNQST